MENDENRELEVVDENVEQEEKKEKKGKKVLKVILIILAVCIALPFLLSFIYNNLSSSNKNKINHIIAGDYKEYKKELEAEKAAEIAEIKRVGALDISEESKAFYEEYKEDLVFVMNYSSMPVDEFKYKINEINKFVYKKDKPYALFYVYADNKDNVCDSFILYFDYKEDSIDIYGFIDEDIDMVEQRKNSKGDYRITRMGSEIFNVCRYFYKECLISSEDKQQFLDFLNILVNNKMSEDELDYWMNMELQAVVILKPVIYLYPETEQDIEVSLVLRNGEFETLYPKFNMENGWKVRAKENGSLLLNGKEYNYLYWEGTGNFGIDRAKGYCVKGEETEKFLEEKLEQLGLNRREANEFIVYWLPLMEKNKYNYISFETDSYIENAELSVSPKPDTVIRVYMSWYGSEEYVDVIAPEEIVTPERKGFTVVEWGGSKIK